MAKKNKTRFFFVLHSDKYGFLTDLSACWVLSIIISNGNRTEWSPIRSVIIRVLVTTKSDDRAAGVRFVYHEYDYRPNWTTRSPITN